MGVIKYKIKISVFFFKIEKSKKKCHFYIFLPVHPSSAPKGFLRMSPGFIMSGEVQGIRSICVQNYYLGRAKVFSSVTTDFGPSTRNTVFQM